MGDCDHAVKVTVSLSFPLPQSQVSKFSVCANSARDFCLYSRLERRKSRPPGAIYSKIESISVQVTVFPWSRTSSFCCFLDVVTTSDNIRPADLDLRHSKHVDDDVGYGLLIIVCVYKCRV